jgi:hypothetical protein
LRLSRNPRHSLEQRHRQQRIAPVSIRRTEHGGPRRLDEYVRRALEVELFERRHVRRILSGRGTTLSVEVLAFEELRTPTPRVRLALRFTLHDDRVALLEKSLTIEEPLA